MCARTGRLRLRQRCVATWTERLLTTTIRHYALGVNPRVKRGYLRRRYVTTRDVCSWRLRQRCVATRTNNYATAMRNASLRARKMFYFCYADGAVATAMRRYIHVNVIFLLHTPQRKCCVCVVRILISAQTGRLQLRQRCVATRTERSLTTAIRRYALRTHKTQNVLFYFYFIRPKAPLGGMGRRARWHSLRTAEKTIHDKRAEALIIIEI